MCKWYMESNSFWSMKHGYLIRCFGRFFPDSETTFDSQRMPNENGALQKLYHASGQGRLGWDGKGYVI